MGIEIERKFLVVGEGWRAHVTRTEALRQGYLKSGAGVTVRVRLVDGERGFLTIKGGGAALARAEFEYPIPAADARALLGFATGAEIVKQRSYLDLPGGEWVVDTFSGRHAGLVLAEVEIDSPNARLELPGWLGREVTTDPRYYNSALAAEPGRGGDK